MFMYITMIQTRGAELHRNDYFHTHVSCIWNIYC